MHVSDSVQCESYPCEDVRFERYTIPSADLVPEDTHILMISEAPAPDAKDGFWADGEPFFVRTTLQAFGDAGVEVTSMADILALGVHVTTAIKCAKTGYGAKAASVKNCSHLLEREMALFPNLRAILCMGDQAIRALNYVARRQTGSRAIPSGSTYKIRGAEYWLGDVRVFPSYLQTGKSFLIEKSKRAMIAEDIASAMRLLG